MESYEVVGIEVIDYVNKQNRRVQGVRVHCSYLLDNCEGICVENFYLSADKFNDSIKIGCIVSPNYNKYGNLQSLTIL